MASGVDRHDRLGTLLARAKQTADMASDEESWEKGDSAAPEGDQPEYEEAPTENTAEAPYDPGHIQDDASDDGADYDPESVGIEPDITPAEETPPSPPSPPRAASKPKMSGGFIVEASDDEEEPAPAQNALVANIASNKPATPAPGLEGFAPIPPGMAGLDPVTLLEARIKEDPRGDMDAWLNLMAEHRSRSRLDDLRKVFHRFLEVFPQAVSLKAILPTSSFLTTSRATFGFNGSNWNLDSTTLSTPNSSSVAA